MLMGGNNGKENRKEHKCSFPLNVKPKYDTHFDVNHAKQVFVVTRPPMSIMKKWVEKKIIKETS